jgi:O-antigen/teichoic acid export membrane protein
LNPLKKLAGQTAIYGATSIVARFLNYLLVPLYTYILKDTADYGVVAEMYSYVSFLIIVLTGGMETALFHFSVKEEINKDKVYSTAMTWIIIQSALFMLVIWFFSGHIGDLLQSQADKPIPYTRYALWTALIITLDGITAIPFAKLREQNKAKKFAVIKCVNILVNILFNLFFVLFCYKVYQSQSGPFLGLVNAIYNPDIGLVGYIFIANILASGATLLLLLPEMIRVKWSFDSALWKRMMIYSLPLLFAGLAGMVNETMDRILLKYLLPKDISMSQVGIYGACYKIAILMTIFIQAYRFAAEPFFFSHSKKEDARALYAQVMKYFVIACSLIFLGTMVNMPWIKYFVGETYWPGLRVVPILLAANLCLGVFFNLSIWYKLTGQTRYGAYLTFFGAAVTLLLNFYWIPRIGYMGSAWATLICYASMMVVSYIIGQKYYPVNYDLKRILGYLSLSLLLFFINSYFASGNLVLSLVTGNLSVIIFCAIAWMLERPKKKAVEAKS